MNFPNGLPVPEDPRLRMIHERIRRALRERYPPRGDNGSAGALLGLLIDRYEDPFLTMKSIGKKLGISSHALYSRFKRKTGLTPMHFVELARLLAALLFMAAGLRPKETARASGFLLTGRMTLAFKRRIGFNSREVLKCVRADPAGLLPVVGWFFPPRKSSQGEFLQDTREFLHGLPLDVEDKSV